MKYKLNTNDYAKILEHYGKKVPKINKIIDKNKTRKLAEKTIAQKMCKCIKSVNKYSKRNEAVSIGICRKSILNRRALSIASFKCRKTPRLTGKNKTMKIYKNSKNIKF